MKKVLVTRVVPECCMDWLREQGYGVVHTMDISEDYSSIMQSGINVFFLLRLCTLWRDKKWGEAF